MGGKSRDVCQFGRNQVLLCCTCDSEKAPQFENRAVGLLYVYTGSRIICLWRNQASWIRRCLLSSIEYATACPTHFSNFTETLNPSTSSIAYSCGLCPLVYSAGSPIRSLCFG